MAKHFPLLAIRRKADVTINGELSVVIWSLETIKKSICPLLLSTYSLPP